ncbi:MAG: methionine synthase [Deltaproteobacteria bacterium]|nr:methionine synthase [Deltaproteobacteria bacterium]
MKKIVTFDPIVIPLPEKMIYRRLGYKTGVTQVTPAQTTEIQKYVEDAQSIIHLMGTALHLPIAERSAVDIRLENGVTFHSRKLSTFLSKSTEVLIMAATAGNDIMEAIRKDTTGSNVTRGVVLDATASEMVDAALDWIVAYFNQLLRRENRTVTQSRFSAGYGDFPLTDQVVIHKILNLEKIGVSITESCMLIPEKSVTAIAGIIG